MINYQELVKKYIIKAIEELSFEDLITIEKCSNGLMKFKPNQEVTYSFKGKFGAFDNLWVEQSSLRKTYKNQDRKFSIAEFIDETRAITQMDDFTLAQFNEEANQTLFGDQVFYSNFDKKVLLDGTYHEIDSSLPGHPKIMNNKGRLGWGAEAIKAFSPEVKNSFQLHWIAARKEQCLIGASGEDQIFIKEALCENEINVLKKKIDFKEFIIFPVHPWQWDRYIQIQYADMIANKDIVPLGLLGPKYGPQVSIRTLTNLSNSLQSDIKLSVSILNTSTVRGIPQRFIEKGHKVSAWFKELVEEDEIIKNKVRIARESGAVSVKSKGLSKFSGAPARFNEMLGCIYRESVPSLLKIGERAIPVAALFFKLEEDGFYFIKELVEKSSIDINKWLQEYFENVVIPLYHLQLEHGVGIVAHGQNVILILRESRPVGVILKDFQGDLRLSEESRHLGSESISSLTVLPAHHLIHDLITGHFITVLRYFSRCVEKSGLLREETFYQILNNSISVYLEKRGQSNPIEAMNLLREEFEKLQVNKVRFEMGYREISGSLKPLVGRNIKNPIVRYGCRSFK